LQVAIEGGVEPRRVDPDAVCSSSDRTHDAMLTLYQQRFGQQIETGDVETRRRRSRRR
jgi:hypothetical protein